MTYLRFGILGCLLVHGWWLQSVKTGKLPESKVKEEVEVKKETEEEEKEEEEEEGCQRMGL